VTTHLQLSVQLGDQRLELFESRAEQQQVLMRFVVIVSVQIFLRRLSGVPIHPSTHVSFA
jgi:hypothetical protein